MDNKERYITPTCKVVTFSIEQGFLNSFGAVGEAGADPTTTDYGSF